jgi:hypothetical protein
VELLRNIKFTITYNALMLPRELIYALMRELRAMENEKRGPYHPNAGTISASF